MWKVLVETWFHRVPNRSRWWPGRSRCSRGFPHGAGAFLPWQWKSWRSKFPSLTSAKVNPNMLISVISLQIFSNFINETSGYHQYIISISSVYHQYIISIYSVILDVGNIHEIHHLMFFRLTCHAGGLRETFRGMMVASARPWFDKAMATIDPLAHWGHKTKKIEQRNNIFDRSTKSQLIF